MVQLSVHYIFMGLFLPGVLFPAKREVMLEDKKIDWGHLRA